MGEPARGAMAGLGGKQMIMLPALLGMNYIDFDSPQMFFGMTTVQLVISGYVTMQVITFTLYYLIYSKIQASRATASTESFVVKAPPLPFGQENPQPDKEMTAVQYDLSKFTELVKQSIIGVCIPSFIFYKWESPKPLFLQMIMAPSAVLESELFMIHVLGRAVEDKPADKADKADKSKPKAVEEEPEEVEEEAK